MSNGLFIEEKKNIDYCHLTSDVGKGISIASDRMEGGVNSFWVIFDVKFDKMHETHDWVV